MTRFALAGSVLLAMVSGAAANGRAPGTSSIHFRLGHDADVVAGMTFGMTISHDGGVTWQWMCEDAVGYGGMYDPDYTYTASGAVVATTFKGLVVNRTGCTFDATALGATFSSSLELGPTGALHVGAADPADAKIYRSDDDGVTFTVSATPGRLNDWWQSITVAPSDPNRLYVAGYRFVPDPCKGVKPTQEHTPGEQASFAAQCTGGNHEGNVRNYILLRSTDKGASFVPMSMTGGKTSADSIMEIAAVSPTNPDLVFVRVTFVDGTIGDAIYRSTDGGVAWTKVLEKQDSIKAFAIRANGDVVAGTPSLGSVVSHDCTVGAACTWQPLANSPHLTCLVENSLGELWGCTQNYGPDGFGIMKTKDLATWTGVLKFQDISAPVNCPAGTVQKDKCEKAWCGMRGQLGLTSSAIDCPSPGDVTAIGLPMPRGSCQTGDVTSVLPAFALVFLMRSRRRAKSR